MNNFSNMNYYIPNNFGYPDIPAIKQQFNDIMISQEKQIDTTKTKTTKNPKKNFTFNICNYNQQANPNELYTVYEGFIRGNMFPDLYNQYKIDRPFEVEGKTEKEQLLNYIDAYSFAAHEINLYLDNNPDDKQMVNLFQKYIEEANKAKEEYARKYSPLFVDQSKNIPWSWNEMPWPWEGR